MAINVGRIKHMDTETTPVSHQTFNMAKKQQLLGILNGRICHPERSKDQPMETRNGYHEDIEEIG